MKLTALTTKALREWLKENDFGVGCRLGREFLYDPNDNFIMVSRIYDNSYDYDFIKVLRELGLHTSFDCLTLSFLHELGHAMTVEDFTDKQYSKYEKALERIATIENEHERNTTYWALAVEYVANVWAVEFANEHQQEVQELEDILSTTIYW